MQRHDDDVTMVKRWWEDPLRSSRHEEYGLMTDTATPTDSPTDWVADHARRYVTSGGENGHLWYGMDGSLDQGIPTLLLTTTGRKSGKLRRTPLIYSTDGDRYVVVASKGGAPQHPHWYLNLLKQPRVTVQVADETFDALAVTATPEEKARLWPMMTAIWPSYDDYTKKTDRDIPVVIFERRQPSATGG
jgi:deazaflavin-dependent oxidoreductase (nitroreductase family)